MANLKTPGLYKRGDIWHMDKVIFGQRVCESTHASTLIEAEQYVAHRLEEIRQSRIYGVRSEHTFREAGEKFIKENQHKRSIRDDVHQLKLLDSFIGDLPLKSVHIGSLQSFINARRTQGVKNRTINYGLVKGSSANLILLCNRSEMLIIKSSKLALDPLILTP